MITPAHVRLMARYNVWQNESLCREADRLGEAARLKQRGAFFGSIQGTLSHLMWGDMMWMSRFAGTPKPAGGIRESASLFADWERLKADRSVLDRLIVEWAAGLTEDWLAGDLSWHSSARGMDLTRPRWHLVAHFFNHQTHHRGQVHAMITQAGGRPDDTDLMILEPA